MFAVVIDRPYYPQVEYADDMAQALHMWREFINEYDEGGEYKTKVFIAEINKLDIIPTHY